MSLLIFSAGNPNWR